MAARKCCSRTAPLRRCSRPCSSLSANNSFQVAELRCGPVTRPGRFFGGSCRGIHAAAARYTMGAPRGGNMDINRRDFFTPSSLLAVAGVAGAAESPAAAPRAEAVPPDVTRTLARYVLAPNKDDLPAAI